MITIKLSSIFSPNQQFTLDFKSFCENHHLRCLKKHPQAPRRSRWSEDDVDDLGPFNEVALMAV